jgi:hypothetical protein
MIQVVEENRQGEMVIPASRLGWIEMSIVLMQMDNAAIRRSPVFPDRLYRKRPSKSKGATKDALIHWGVTRPIV